MNRNLFPVLMAALFLGAACSPSMQRDRNPCADANGIITLDNLVRNSMNQTYEQCLSEIREIATSELRD